MMGFYKMDEVSGTLLCGCEDVFAPTFTLRRDEHETYDYPVDGWYWFDSEDQARDFFGLLYEDRRSHEERRIEERRIEDLGIDAAQ